MINPSDNAQPLTPCFCGNTDCATKGCVKYRPLNIAGDAPRSTVYDRIRGRAKPETREKVRREMSEALADPIYVGVDPALRADGFWVAVVDMTDRTVAYKRFEDVLYFHDWLRSPDAPLSCFVCVENSNLQNKSFDMAGSKMEIARKGRNVGTNQAVSELAFRSAVRRYGAKRVFEVSPKEKGPKWSEAQAGAVLKSERLTVVTNGENQDCRDALKLALISRSKALLSGKFAKPKKANR